MSQKYTAEEVRAHAAILRDWRNGFDPGVGNDDAAGMLDAYADLLERIKTDEMAVPIGYTRVDCIEALKEQDFAPMIRLRQRGDYTVPLYLRPPAQAAQGEPVAGIQVPREGLPRVAQFIPYPAWLRLSPGIHDLFTAPPAQPAERVVEGWKLGMAVLQSDLYRELSEEDRAICDALVASNPHITAAQQADR
jgi:hypothetical protein